MINLDDLGKKLGETVDNVSAIAGKSIEIQKLKNQIRILEKGNDSDIEGLGRMVYQEFVDGADLEDKVKEICEGIKSREEGITETLQKIALLRGVLNCPACQKEVAKDMVYCPYCATELPPPPAEAAEPEEDAVEEVADEAEEATDEAEEPAVETPSSETP